MHSVTFCIEFPHGGYKQSWKIVKSAGRTGMLWYPKCSHLGKPLLPACISTADFSFVRAMIVKIATLRESFLKNVSFGVRGPNEQKNSLIPVCSASDFLLKLYIGGEWDRN